MANAVASSAQAHALRKKKKGRLQRRPVLPVSSNRRPLIGGGAVVQPAIPRRAGTAARPGASFLASFFPGDDSDRRDDCSAPLVRKSHIVGSNFCRRYQPECAFRRFSGPTPTRPAEMQRSGGLKSHRRWLRTRCKYAALGKIRRARAKNCRRPARLFTASFGNPRQIATTWRIAHTVASIVQGATQGV
jgi:hypothetical protein